jgi:hypothetical protein
MTEYTTNSPSNGIVIRRLEDIGFGVAKRDFGESISRRSNGASNIMDDKDSWTTKARARSDNEVCPRAVRIIARRTVILRQRTLASKHQREEG